MNCYITNECCNNRLFIPVCSIFALICTLITYLCQCNTIKIKIMYLPLFSGNIVWAQSPAEKKQQLGVSPATRFQTPCLPFLLLGGHFFLKQVFFFNIFLGTVVVMSQTRNLVCVSASCPNEQQIGNNGANRPNNTTQIHL